jgi:Ca-activated chloride channel family protein
MHVAAQLDLDLLALNAEDHVTCLVRLEAPVPPEAADRAGQALVVVLDRSGSMGGGRLEGAKRALVALVRRLAPQDAFGLVTFDSEAELVVPVRRMADHTTSEVADLIGRVRPRGTTDLSAGFLLGLREAKRLLANAEADGEPLAGATLLIVSDGHANAGIVDRDELTSVAARAAAEARITTSTLGVGTGYDEVLLTAMTDGGGGEHRFAPDPDSAVAELASSVTDLLSKSVVGAVLRVRPQPGLVLGVEVRGRYRHHFERPDVVVSIGDLFGGEERTALVRLHVPALATLGTATIADVIVEFTSLPDLREHRVSLPVSVNVVPGDEARGRIPDPIVTAESLLLDVAESKAGVAETLRSGDSTRARADLEDLSRRLRDGRAEVDADAAPEAAARLDEAAAELDGLRAELVDRDALWSAKRMQEDSSWNLRGRRSRMKGTLADWERQHGSLDGGTAPDPTSGSDRTDPSGDPGEPGDGTPPAA